MKESKIQADIIQALNKTKRCLVKRNHTGFGVMHGRPMSFGLGKGGTDLVGILAVTGRVFCLEIKTPAGRTDPARAKEQEEWQAMIRKWGGFATVVRSVEQAIEALTRAERGESQ
jgi:hypothetical protein